MRVALVLLTVSVIGIWAGELPETERQNLKQIHERCQANPATHADENILKKLTENVDNPQVGAHMLCMSVGAELQKPNGHLNIETIRNKIAMVTDDKHQVDGLVTKCAVEKDSSQKTAFWMWICFHENNINYYHKLE